MVARAIPPSKKAPDYFRKRSGPFAVVDPTVWSVVCRLTPSGAERAPVRAAQVMNGDGDGGVGGVGSIAVRTTHPMVG